MHTILAFLSALGLRHKDLYFSQLRPTQMTLQEQFDKVYTMSRLVHVPYILGKLKLVESVTDFVKLAKNICKLTVGAIIGIRHIFRCKQVCMTIIESLL